ncbi:MAG: phosphoglucosamine mutase [Planctomycetes bacterium]|nr:phosphoglucosamine mutase [Planctomycetota bacterium]MCC7396686.1 phosphoglucosamine mutase [Planctomycetota bacterium]
MSKIDPPKFGTDGLRGRAGDAPMDPETLRRVGCALGVLLQRSGGEQKRVLVGNDGRESAGWILEALAQGLTAAEVAIGDVGLCTTPALAFLTRTQPCDAGVMISASHNPAHDNGIKIFAVDGTKLRDEHEAEIANLAVELRPAVVRTPRVRDRADLLVKYEEQLAEAFPSLDLGGRKVCIDAANGGGSLLAPRLLRAFGAEVVEIACEPDGSNINDGTGALHPEVLAAAVREHGAALGICLDGDGDRGIFVDELGTVRDGDDVLSLFGRALHQRGELPGDRIVATVMSNLGLHKALREAGVGVHVTPVGDRNVFLAMQQLGCAIGGEQSGHILFRDHHLTGDGLYTGLRLLQQIGQGPASAAFAAFHRFPQRLVNVPVRSKPDLDSVPAIVAKKAAVERQLGDDGRLLLRYSGTEPKCRVMVEAQDAATCARLVDEMAAVVKAELGAS